ncbi:methylisocitrate lyase [Salinicoccus halitifaciens]|uniref:Methylisocitrate lyase n=1 Tax=Salinicoccus halitifaciens TaxID=1073415 RepID=A0ABV2E8L5_9STAP|nr:methylisocitrate lyase [Salinicoccus halitifaciens]MCD2137881.1 methylisocitrate lyase [Salinicoccus halitifaciens]
MTWLTEERKDQRQLAEEFMSQVEAEETLQVAGAHDGMSALLARESGFKALYLSGGALSASKGIPDIGLLTIDDVAHKAQEIIRASNMPVLVDIDNGFGEPLNVARTCHQMVEVGVAAIQIEDQKIPKKCGHLNGKQLITKEDMVKKLQMIKKISPSLKIVARSDAFAIEGMEGMLNRLKAYTAAGADIIFPEAMTDLEDFKKVKSSIDIPVLANMTEFGKTDYISKESFDQIGINLVIYPVSSLRAAAQSVKELYRTILEEGSQKPFLDKMQTRKELYEILNLREYEEMDNNISKTILPQDKV